jgi:hypothetical protein
MPIEYQNLENFINDEERIYVCENSQYESKSSWLDPDDDQFHDWFTHIFSIEVQ